jgi:hypothetical protein
VDDAGRTHFAANPQGRHQYLTATAERLLRLQNVLIELASRPPDRLMPPRKERVSQAVPAAR